MRAFYHRVLRDDQTVLELPSGFEVRCPLINHTIIGKCGQETEKSTAVTVLWHRGIKCSEVLDGTIGSFSEDFL